MNQALRAVVLATAILPGACSQSGNSAGASENDATELENDLAVYSLVLDDESLRGFNDLGLPVEYLVVFSDSAAHFDWLESVAGEPASAPDWLAEHFPGLRADCLQDFAAKNLEPISLPSLHADLPVHLVDRDRAAEFWRAGSGSYIRFWDLFPDASGMMELSRIGHSAAMDQALVYCASTQGGLAGAGHLVFLVNDGGWRIETSHVIWVS